MVNIYMRRENGIMYWIGIDNVEGYWVLRLSMVMIHRRDELKKGSMAM